VIELMYPHALEAGDVDAADMPALKAATRIVSHDGIAAVVLAMDLDTMLAEARLHGGVIEVAPQVGDFVAYGQPLFLLHGAAAGIPDVRLVATVALGPERTLEQDPLFAFRITADIALKALSPAINDPTTAVLALDQVHRMLRSVGMRRLDAGVLRDEDGLERVLTRTPRWEDFVNISCSEIRACGVSSMQVARRLRAMLEDLVALLPQHRLPVLRRELDLLDRAVRSAYSFPEDAALARVPDVQGLGSVPRMRATEGR